MKSIFLRLFLVSFIIAGFSITPTSTSAMRPDPLLEANASETETSQTSRRPRSNSDVTPLSSPERSPFGRKASAQEPRAIVYIEIVEDNKVNQIVLKGYVNSFIQQFTEKHGITDLIKVILANNAEEGIMLWNMYNPRVIFLDSHLGAGKTGKDILHDRIVYCGGFIFNEIEKKALTVSQDKLEADLKKDQQNLAVLSNKSGKKNNRRSKINHASTMVKASEENIQFLKNLKKRQVKTAQYNRLKINLGHVVCISNEITDNLEMLKMGATEMCPKPHTRDAIFRVLRQLF